MAASARQRRALVRRATTGALTSRFVARRVGPGLQVVWPLPIPVAHTMRFTLPVITHHKRLSRTVCRWYSASKAVPSAVRSAVLWQS